VSGLLVALPRWRYPVVCKTEVGAIAFLISVTLFGGIGVLVIVGIRAVTLWMEVGRAAPAQAHHHDHDHHH